MMYQKASPEHTEKLQKVRSRLFKFMREDEAINEISPSDFAAIMAWCAGAIIVHEDVTQMTVGEGLEFVIENIVAGSTATVDQMKAEAVQEYQPVEKDVS